MTQKQKNALRQIVQNGMSGQSGRIVLWPVEIRHKSELESVYILLIRVNVIHLTNRGQKSQELVKTIPAHSGQNGVTGPFARNHVESAAVANREDVCLDQGVQGDENRRLKLIIVIPSPAQF